MKMLHAIPSLPVADISRSVAFYRDKLNLPLAHFDEQGGFAIFRRDSIEIHLWAATDEAWKTRRSTPSPVVSGSESFLASTASCRVAIEGIDEWHGFLHPMGILHPNAPLRDTDYGTREFGVLDLDNNLITFFERRKQQSPGGA